MSNKHVHKLKNKVNIKPICVTIPIETDEYLRKFILDNAYMYNKIRNDFVEEANKYKGSDCMYDNFNARRFKTSYYHDIEMPERRYDYYCTGLSEQVSENFMISRNTIRSKNLKILKNHLPQDLGSYHYKRFDYNRYTFRVKLKPNINNDHGNVRTKLSIIDSNNIKFRVRSNKFGRIKEVITIKLKESLYEDIIQDKNDPIFIKHYYNNGITNDCMFYLSDIKDIAFKYELGNYYIQLFINVTYLINRLSNKSSNKKIAGIDTGIRHPITIYDGNKTYYISMDDKTSRKIHYLERRRRRLQSIKDKKWRYNFNHYLPTNSNNIIKLCKKIRKLYKKITNIKRNWARNIAKFISTTYDTIVVDTFEQPDKTTKESLPKKIVHKINYNNRFHIMYYTNMFIKHDCDKFGCNYIESPEDTTRTCNICGHINEHLKLEDKYLVCKHCRSKIERDENAAKNCYDYALSMS